MPNYSVRQCIWKLFCWRNLRLRWMLASCRVDFPCASVRHQGIRAVQDHVPLCNDWGFPATGWLRAELQSVQWLAHVQMSLYWDSPVRQEPRSQGLAIVPGLPHFFPTGSTTMSSTTFGPQIVPCPSAIFPHPGLETPSHLGRIVRFQAASRLLYWG